MRRRLVNRLGRIALVDFDNIGLLEDNDKGLIGLTIDFETRMAGF